MDAIKTITDGLTGAVGGIVGGPIGMALGLLTGVAPDLVSLFTPHLAGPQASNVAAAVVQVVAAATGKPNPTPSVVAGLTPEQRDELTVRLQQIAVQAEANRQANDAAVRANELDTLRAGLADVAGARAQTVALANSGSGIAWGAPMYSLLIVVAFAYAEYLAWHSELAANAVQIGIVETLKLLTVAVGSYWVGSSAGSKDKDVTIAQSSAALANSTPVR